MQDRRPICHLLANGCFAPIYMTFNFLNTFVLVHTVHSGKAHYERCLTDS